MIDRKSLARLLGGRVDKRGAVEARLPGGSVSFTVRLMHDAPDGFVIFGLRGEERELAREHVRERLAKLRGRRWEREILRAELPGSRRRLAYRS
jgi:hypothetical protein